MKKFLALILALVMVFSLTGIAFAEDINADSGSSTSDVKIVVNETSAVYHVVITWKTLEFTYNQAAEWDPRTHSYGTQEGWASDKIDTALKVVNHSNAPVTITTGFNHGADTTATNFGVTASVFVESGTAALGTAVGTAVADAPTVAYGVSVAGTPNNSWNTGNDVVGTITVSIDHGDVTSTYPNP